MLEIIWENELFYESVEALLVVISFELFSHIYY